MSLYNLLFGMNPNTDLILALLGLRQHDVERFRNCGIDWDSKQITIYTRTGGGNREDYPNDALVENPSYLSDEDDDFDSTYATYYFKFPDALAGDIEKLKDIRVNGIPAAIVAKVQDVMGRKEERDKKQALYESHSRMCEQFRRNGDAIQFNGWSLAPLQESVIEQVFKQIEEHGYWGGDSLNFSKFCIETNIPRWNMDAKKPELEYELARVKIDLERDWKMDTDFWERTKKKFGEKYPKAIAYCIEKRWVKEEVVA